MNKNIKHLLTRQIPHIHGNWSTLISIKLDDFIKLNNIINNNDITILSNQHISLSRNVYIKEFQIKTLVEKLSNELSQFKRFKIGFDEIAYYKNDTKTTSFVALNVGYGKHHVFLFYIKVIRSYIIN